MSPTQQISTMVKNLDLSGVVGKLQEKEKFDAPRAMRAVEMYRQFLQMMQSNASEVLVPNEDVDTAWHHHILDTEAYVKDCQMLFGQYLHHNPYYYGTAAFDASCDRTQELFQKTFGQSETFLITHTESAKPALCSGMLREPVKQELGAALCSGMLREPVKQELKPSLCSGMLREPVKQELAPALCSGMLRDPIEVTLKPALCSGMLREPVKPERIQA